MSASVSSTTVNHSTKTDQDWGWSLESAALMAGLQTPTSPSSPSAALLDATAEAAATAVGRLAAETTSPAGGAAAMARQAARSDYEAVGKLTEAAEARVAELVARAGELDARTASAAELAARAAVAARAGKHLPAMLLQRDATDLTVVKDGVMTSLAVSDEAKRAIMATLSSLHKRASTESVDALANAHAHVVSRPGAAPARAARPTHRVHGDGLHEGAVREPTHFTIEAMQAGDMRAASGGQQFIVTIRGVARARARITDHDDGSYTVAWTPPMSGQYRISIVHSGIALPGSPFPFSASSPAPHASKCIIRGGSLTSAVSRERQEFEIGYRDRLGTVTKAVELDVFVEPAPLGSAVGGDPPPRIVAAERENPSASDADVMAVPKRIDGQGNTAAAAADQDDGQRPQGVAVGDGTFTRHRRMRVKVGFKPLVVRDGFELHSMEIGQLLPGTIATVLEQRGTPGNVRARIALDHMGKEDQDGVPTVRGVTFRSNSMTFRANANRSDLGTTRSPRPGGATPSTNRGSAMVRGGTAKPKLTLPISERRPQDSSTKVQRAESSQPSERKPRGEGLRSHRGDASQASERPTPESKKSHRMESTPDTERGRRSNRGDGAVSHRGNANRPARRAGGAKPPSRLKTSEAVTEALSMDNSPSEVLSSVAEDDEEGPMSSAPLPSIAEDDGYRGQEVAGVDELPVGTKPPLKGAVHHRIQQRLGLQLSTEMAIEAVRDIGEPIEASNPDAEAHPSHISTTEGLKQQAQREDGELDDLAGQTGWITIMKNGNKLVNSKLRLDTFTRNQHSQQWIRRLENCKGEKMDASKDREERTRSSAPKPDRTGNASKELGKLAMEMDSDPFSFAFGGVFPGTLHAKGKLLDVHRVSYSIGVAGRYLLHVRLRQQATSLPGSPFLLQVAPAAAFARTSYLSHNQITCEVGEWAEITLLSLDKMGNACHVGGANITCTCNRDDVQSAFEDQQDGTYLLKWQSLLTGSFRVEVMINKIPVVNSPLTITLHPTVPVLSRSDVSGSGLEGGEAREPCYVRIGFHDQYDNIANPPRSFYDEFEMTMALLSDKELLLLGKVTSGLNLKAFEFEGSWKKENGRDYYIIKYMPLAMGDYNLYMWFLHPDGKDGRIPFPGSPFKLNIEPNRNDTTFTGGTAPRDYSVERAVFDDAQKQWGPCTVDAFASEATAMVPRFWANDGEGLGGAEATDAFSQTWSSPECIWAHPPTEVIPRLVDLLKRPDRTALVYVCAPGWQNYQWYVDLNTLSDAKIKCLPGKLQRIAADAPNRLEEWPIVIFRIPSVEPPKSSKAKGKAKRR